MTYDSNGGTTYSSEKYTVNTKVTLDKLPTKTSYQFTGWSLDKDLKQSATNVVMDKDKTVYAGWKKVSESVLDLENTYAYIIGFPEDYRTGERSNDPSLFPVKPTAPITRAEVTTVFFRMLTDSMREKNWTTSNSYTDVKADHWFNNAVSVMTKLGIVQGVGNDQFKPNAPITRGEMGAIAARFARMMDSTTTTTMSFTDIAGHWAEADILYCALKYQNDFEKAIIASVNHSGDSDSTGAVTGNILGAYLGYDAIPEVFLQDLELKDLTLEVADELCGNAPQEYRYCSVRMEYEENKNRN